MKDIKDIIDQFDFDQKCMQTSFVKENGKVFNGIFNNYGDRALGHAMYEVLKDMIAISKHSWKLDKDEWKDWVDEAFEELDKED